MSADPKPNSGRKLFYGLFIFPLLILAGMIVMVISVVLITHEDETPESLIAAIKKGPERKRWQKASELSNELNRAKPGVRSEALEREIARILEDRGAYDPKTRAYMAAALSHFRTPSAEAALVEALDDTDAEVRFYAIWSIGTLGARGAAPSVRRFLSDERPDLRTNAAYVLGALGDKESVPALKPLVNDAATDVRWNAALALARLGDDSGGEVLVSMLDRAALEVTHGMGEDAIERTMVNAVKGLALIRGPGFIKILESVSRSEKNLRVRQAAIEALRYSNAADSGKISG